MSLRPYKADMHIHTVLSPCGDLEMSPINIVKCAKSKGLDMIAITDHNTTRQVSVTQKIGHSNGLFVIGGVEITTKEEAHALAFFGDESSLSMFQFFLVFLRNNSVFAPSFLVLVNFTTPKIAFLQKYFVS